MEFQASLFNPAAQGGQLNEKTGDVAFRAGDAPDDLYLYTPRTILALNVALATERPLLISGEPGSGKSALARSAAAVLRAWYYQETVTSRTQAVELLWTFDALRRLSDASTNRPDDLLPRRYYVEPGTLWWVFDPGTAADRGKEEIPAGQRASNPGKAPRPGAHDRAVLLLDEIDKADPDVPNDLLEPFDRETFLVRETGETISATRPTLLVLTTNGERELPPAFLRRCVTLRLDPPTEDWFTDIADRRYGPADNGLHRDVAREVMRLRGLGRAAGVREPGTGEYLDALDVCRELKIDTRSGVWSDVVRSVLWKHDRPPEPAEQPEQPEEGVAAPARREAV